jgi:hypothetical protein
MSLFPLGFRLQWRAHQTAVGRETWKLTRRCGLASV